MSSEVLPVDAPREQPTLPKSIRKKTLLTLAQLSHFQSSLAPVLLFPILFMAPPPQLPPPAELSIHGTPVFNLTMMPCKSLVNIPGLKCPTYTVIYCRPPSQGVNGQKLKHSIPLYRFPASIRMESSSALCDALIGRRRLIRSIARCRDLTSLSLDSLHVDGYSLDLNLIPRCFPFLSELSIANFAAYYGSLQECSSLRHLCLQLLQFKHRDFPTYSYLPLISSETLISLSLWYWQFSPPVDSYGAFNGFSNLRSLRIEESLDTEIYCIVAHSSIALHELDVSIPRDDTNLRPFFEMFDSPALSHLEFLRITEYAPWPHQLYPSSFYWKRQSKLLQIITRALQHLKALELEMRINKHWIPLLAGLSSLKSLKWNIRMAQARSEELDHPVFEDYLKSQGDETGDDAADLPVGELETMFRDVWRSSLNPPHIDITTPRKYLRTEFWSEGGNRLWHHPECA